MTLEHDYQQRTATAITKAWQRAPAKANSNSHHIDLHAWPEDVREVVETVCELWHLKPPETKAGKAFWIAQSRELRDACAEFGTEAIHDYRLEFERVMAWNKRKTGQGTAPHTVSSPRSLVEPVRGWAGVMRERGTEQSRDRYVSGEYAEFIEH